MSGVRRPPDAFSFHQRCHMRARLLLAGLVLLVAATGCHHKKGGGGYLAPAPVAAR